MGCQDQFSCLPHALLLVVMISDLFADHTGLSEQSVCASKLLLRALILPVVLAG